MHVSPKRTDIYQEFAEGIFLILGTIHFLDYRL